MTRILGLARLEKKLARMPARAKAEIRAAMEAAAEVMVATMKSLVKEETGALRDSIGWTWGRAPKGAGIVAQAKSRMAADLTLTIYAGNAEAFYARFQEFGTANTPAQPFFFVAYRAHRKTAKRRIRAATRKAARKEAG